MSGAAILDLGVQISLFLVVLSFGLRAGLADIFYLFNRPLKFLRAFLSIDVIMPVFTIILVKSFTLNPVIEVALVALSVSPVPPALSNKTLMAGGHESFMFGLLATVSLLAIIVIPMTIRLDDFVLEREINVPELAVMKLLITGILFPLLAGMLVRSFARNFADRYSGLIGKVGMVVLLLSVLPMMFALWSVMWSLTGNGTILALATFTVVGIVAGHVLGGPKHHSQAVLALTTSSRHPGIAISLATVNVGDSDTKLAVGAVVLYFLINVMITTPYLVWMAGRSGDRQIKEEKLA
jgi:BASS family bile acid:Na+ symporter